MHSAMINYLDEVARQGSIRKASKVLHVASSAVNRQILKLEDELGVRIFERVPGGVNLTPAGQVVLDHARKVLYEFSSMKTVIDDLRGMKIGHLRLSTLDSLTYKLLPRALQRFMKDFPGVNCSVRVAGPGEIIEQVAQKQVDFGITFDCYDHPDARCIAKISTPMGAIVAPGHPLASKQSVSLAECLQYPRISSNITKDTEITHIENALNFNGKDTFVEGCSSNSFDMVKFFLKQRLGVGFFTRIGIQDELDANKLSFLPLIDSKLSDMKMGLFIPINKEISAFQQTMARELSAEMNRLR